MGPGQIAVRYYCKTPTPGPTDPFKSVSVEMLPKEYEPQREERYEVRVVSGTVQGKLRTFRIYKYKTLQEADAAAEHQRKLALDEFPHPPINFLP